MQMFQLCENLEGTDELYKQATYYNMGSSRIVQASLLNHTVVPKYINRYVNGIIGLDNSVTWRFSTNMGSILIVHDSLSKTVGWVVFRSENCDWSSAFVDKQLFWGMLTDLLDLCLRQSFEVLLWKVQTATSSVFVLIEHSTLFDIQKLLSRASLTRILKTRRIL